MFICVLVWGPEFVVQARTVPHYLPSYLREGSGNHLLATLFRIAELPLEFLFGERLGQQLPGWMHLFAFLIVVG